MAGGGRVSVYFSNRIYTNYVGEYFVEMPLLFIGNQNSLEQSLTFFSFFTVKMTLGIRGKGISFCFIESQNHMLGLEDIVEVTWTTACILEDAGK